MIESERDFERFTEILRERVGISLERGKEYLVQDRLAPVLAEEGLPNLLALCERLLDAGADSDLESRVVDAMTTNETSFFRDGLPYKILAEDVLPEIRDSQAKMQQLRIWSAACSTGQEPYSIAMTIREQPGFEDWKTVIFATDISEEVLKQARDGTYSRLEVNRGLPVQLLARYFDQNGARWSVKETLRELVEFRTQNLLESFARYGPLDIVFIRNVLIYFERERKIEIVERITQILRPGGYLFLGTAESAVIDRRLYEQVGSVRSSCFRRIGNVCS